MKPSKALHWGALGALGLALAAGEGCNGGGLVGGDCAPGWVQCGQECVDLADDPAHCGACDAACGAGALCAAGLCVGGLAGGGTAGGDRTGGGPGFDGQGGGTGGRGSSDNWGGEGGIAGEGGRGAESGGGGESGAQSGSGGLGGAVGGGEGGLGGAGQGGHGGASGQGGAAQGGGGAGGQAGQGGGLAGQGGTGGTVGGAQGGGQGGAGGVAGGGQGGAGGLAGGAQGGGQGGDGGEPGAGAGGAGGAAGQGGAGQGGGGQGGGTQGGGGQGGGSPCEPPLTLCDEACVDLQNDEYNCGLCGRVCPTGVCQSGACVGAKTGHEVVIGFDYASVPVASVDPKRVLGNAIFLNAAEGNGSWRVLGFDPHGSPTRAAVDAIVAQQAASHGISSLGVEYAADVPELVARLGIQSFDALLVYDEPGAPAGALGQAGATARTALDSFSSAGGCVVVLGGGGGVNEMWSFVREAGILPAAGAARATLPASLYNSAPADGVGIGVATVFAARPHTASWQLASPEGVVVVATSVGDKPVVIHKPVLP